MNTKALRQKVLDLAIHGKLVPQNPNDESATVLLEKIRAEKAEKIKKGELKVDKKDSFIFVGSDKRHYEQFADGTVKDIEDEIPFDVPEGWAWCRFGNFIDVRDGTHYSPKYVENGYPFVTSKNLVNGKIDFTDVKYISEKDHKEYIQRSFVEDGDILFAMIGSIGNPVLVKKDREFSIKNVALFKPYSKQLTNMKYLFYFLLWIQENLRSKAKGGMQPFIPLSFFRTEVLIPIPPSEEQFRIISNIEEILSKIDSLEKNKIDLENIIKQTKSKILDLAIHGKLVPQDPNDEPAEELLKRIATSDNRPYKKIDEDEAPFEVPSTWKWAKLKDITNYIGDGDWIESKDQSETGIRLIQTGNIGFGNFKDKEGKYHFISSDTFERLNCNEIFEGDVLISRLPEPVGRACILPKLEERCITAVDCSILRINENIISKELFVLYTQSNKYLELIKDNCTGTTRLRISRSNLEKIYVPLPPLNEQKRILTKINLLFQELDKIILNLV